MALWYYVGGIARRANPFLMLLIYSAALIFMRAFRYLLDQSNCGLFALRPAVLDEFQRDVRERSRALGYHFVSATALLAFAAGVILRPGAAVAWGFAYALIGVIVLSPRAISCWLLSPSSVSDPFEEGDVAMQGLQQP